MKTFVFIINEDSVDFLDKKDRALYKGLISHMRNQGITKFQMTMEPYSGKLTSHKQLKLWGVVVSYVASQSAQQDDVQTIEETLNIFKKPVQDMNNKEFNELLEYSFSVVLDMFGVEMVLDEHDNIQIIKR